MNIVEKIEFITNWTYKNYIRDTNQIKHESGENDFSTIEKMIDEKLPKEFIEVYSQINGENGENSGIFFGLQFISTKKIKLELEFSISLLKPVERKIIDTHTSKKILDKISDLYLKSIPNKKKFGLFSKKWTKAKFECSNQSYSGITVEYENGDEKNYNLKESFKDKIFALGKEIHKLEEKNYNWDSLEFVLFPNGKYIVERKDYIWENEIDFSSCPDDSIRKKYFHYKWLPIFSDYGGNFIGFDLDPDKNGTKGQIIIYGRDEEKMIVLADSLNDFLDLSIKEINEHPNQFLTETHIHEIFKRIKNCA